MTLRLKDYFKYDDRNGTILFESLIILLPIDSVSKGIQLNFT